MSENYFIFKGTDSRDLGIRVTSMPPRIKPAKRYEEHTVPARHGKARIWDGAYESIQLPVSMYLPYEQDATVSGLPQIMRALDGEGWLILSDRPSRKYFAVVYGEAVYDAWIQGFQERVCTILFEADPQAYFTENSPVTVSASGAFVSNPGNQKSQPVIEVTGSGDVTLMVGQQISTLHLGAETATMTIDVPDGQILLGGEIAEDGLEGDLPILIPGANAVSWSGSVTQVKITVNAFDVG